MLPLAIVYARPDLVALFAWQQDIVVQHSFERSRAQIGTVEEYRNRIAFFGKTRCKLRYGWVDDEAVAAVIPDGVSDPGES